MNKIVNELIQRINNAKLPELNYEELHKRIKDARKLKGSELNCYISEYMTENALRNAKFKFYNKDDLINTNFKIKQNYYNLKFYDNTKPVFELDFIGEYKNQKIIIETKSGSLKEYDVNKTQYIMNEMQRIIQEPINMIFFASFKTKQRYIEFKEQIKNNTQVHAINLKLTKEDYQNHARSYYEFRDGPSTEDELTYILKNI